MKVLGFDLGNYAGWALLNNLGKTGLSRGGVRLLKQPSHECEWEHAGFACDVLLDIICITKPDVIGYELNQFQQKGSSASHSAGRYEGWLWKAVADYCDARDGLSPTLWPIYTSTVKMTAGSGRFDKDQMREAALAQWGPKIENLFDNCPKGHEHDLVDACWVAMAALRYEREGA